MKILLRISVYLIIMILFSFSIRQRFNAIEEESKISLNSFPNYYKNNGIPIKVYGVTKKDLTIRKKLSAKITSQNTLEAKIDSSIKNKLKVGDKFESHYMGFTIKGSVSYVSSTRSYTDGLYSAKFKTSKKLSLKEGLIPLNVDIDKIKKTIVIPNSSLLPKNDKFFVWVAKDRMSVLKEVKLKHYNQSEVEVEGLTEGELVIIEGQKQLRENTKLAIVGRY